MIFVLGAHKNSLNETVLLSTHNICFGCKIKLFFCYTLLTKVSGITLFDKVLLLSIIGIMCFCYFV